MIGREVLYYCEDFEAAFKTYTKGFGFAVKAKYDFGFAILDAGGPCGIIGLMDKKHFSPNPPLDPSPTPRLSLKSEDIEAEVAGLIERGISVSEIKGKKESWRWATFVDSDGNPFFIWEGDES
jgi:predicted enzyme related to lactoylglutathione lyase